METRTEILKVQRLSNTIRVVIEGRRGSKYRVSAQQYIPDRSQPWETRNDGWRDTQTRYSPTLEGAKWIFEDMVQGEQRWLETIGR